MVDSFLELWIMVGRNVDDYDHLTIAEIWFHITARQKQMKLDLKSEASLVHWLGFNIAQAIHDSRKYPPLKKAFPELFTLTEEEQVEAFIEGARNHNQLHSK